MTKYITYVKDKFVYIMTEKNEKRFLEDFINSKEDLDEYDRYENNNDGYVSLRVDSDVRVY